jgi:histidinol-phosphate aminotransferase
MKDLDVIPNLALQVAKPYAVPSAGSAIDLWLDANEGPTPPIDLLRVLEDVQRLRRYPSTEDVRGLLASRLRVRPAQIAVTAGGDDAIDRACRSVLCPGKEIILTPPTFEMFHRYAALTGATEVRVPWLGLPLPDGSGFPIEQVLSSISDRTAAIALVTPNNPTGLVMTGDEVRRIARAAAHALIILDLAYTEFADEDLQSVGLEFPNIVSIRTLSKAWGLAGLRVGYAVGDERVITWLRSAGGPYAVSSPSAAIVCRALETCEHMTRAYVDRVRVERVELADVLTQIGLDPWPSQANFVTIGSRFDVDRSPYDVLRRQGISTRIWNNRPELPAYATRITCPGNPIKFARLIKALRTCTIERTS